MTASGDGLDGLIEARTGHFRLESGHHGSLMLDLESLFVSPARIEPFAGQLADQVATHDVEIVCGPLTGGAFLAQNGRTPPGLLVHLVRARSQR